MHRTRGRNNLERPNINQSKKFLNTSPFIAATLILVLVGLGACATQPSTQGPSPSATPKRDSETRPAPPAATPAPSPPSAPLPPEVAEKSLDSILSDYTKKWRQDYPLRVKLGPKCPASKGYSYGMRMLQPATFQGDFADAVKRKYGNTTNFIVIAVAPGSAAAKLNIAVGDRLLQVGRVKSTQPDAGKTLATESRKWSAPYSVVALRDGKEVLMTLKPDLLCEIPL
jgi:hypothetical protein